VNAKNIASLQAQYDVFSRKNAEEALHLYVEGGGDVGLVEENAVGLYRPIKNADIIDIGCGIGRLTKHLINEPIPSYLGTDILAFVLQEARKYEGHDSRFSFKFISDISIPANDDSANIVCVFSVMTHLLDADLADNPRAVTGTEASPTLHQLQNCRVNLLAKSRHCSKRLSERIRA
jgi:SAM-dependent methyltransferase